MSDPKSKFDICRDKIIEYMFSRKEFTIDELCNDIIASGGVFRVSSDQCLNEYLEHFEEKGFLRYSPAERKYGVIVEF